MGRPISVSGGPQDPLGLGWSDQGHEVGSSVRDEQLLLRGGSGISWDASLGRLQGTFHQKEAPGGEPGHATRSMSPRW